jgi:hypothetical protein
MAEVGGVIVSIFDVVSDDDDAGNINLWFM